MDLHHAKDSSSSEPEHAAASVAAEFTAAAPASGWIRLTSDSATDSRTSAEQDTDAAAAADETAAAAAAAAEPTAAAPASGWLRVKSAGSSALSEMAGKVAIFQGGGRCGRCISYIGPAFLIAVGYMDPGNWATSLAAGSTFGFAHLFVILLASCMGMFLQTLAVCLGIATERDLAQACRDAYSKRVSVFLWLTAEVAIAATDIAEVIGSAIAFKLLAGLPLIAGVFITVVDVLLITFLQSRVRLVETIVACLIAFIAVAFIVQIAFANPPAIPLLLGFVPSSGLVTDAASLYVGIGIIGATVMPHNLYLHSALVHSRASGKDDEGKNEARFFLTLDSIFALAVALFVNAAILIVAAAAFYSHGEQVSDLETAYTLLQPILGNAAPILFAVALLAAGQNSTLTGVMAGQVVMEGFLHWRVSPVVRRLVTRCITLIPVVLVTVLVGDAGINSLLVLSQVILSFQLPFALVPLMLITSDREKMGRLANSKCAKLTGWAIVALISGLNAYLIVAVAMNGM